MRNTYDVHEFYCMKCGQKNMSLQRKVNHKHAKHHRKKLWCWHCKQEVNCIECKNDQEVQEFLENFKAGKYQEELENSIKVIEQEKRIWA